MANDPFITGLERVFARRKDLAPSRISKAAGLDGSTIRKMISAENASPRVKSAVNIAKAMGMTVEEILAEGEGATPSHRSARITGCAGKGAAIRNRASFKSEGSLVQYPAELPPSGIAGIAIEGDYMEPIFRPGDVLFYSTPIDDDVPDTAIGRQCICEDADGRGWIKQVVSGSRPGLFNLIALNLQASNMHDVQLKWAAPVLLHWPRELVREL